MYIIRIFYQIDKSTKQLGHLLRKKTFKRPYYCINLKKQPTNLPAASTIKTILEDCVLKFISNGEKITDTNIIFKRYVRENISLGGHGIGLSIVKDICDKYKIKIDVTSQENHNIFSYRLNCHTNITSKG